MLERLTIPLMCAPMSYASSPELAVACCAAGILGGWQGGIATGDAQFEEYLLRLEGVGGAPAIVNLPARAAGEAWMQQRLARLEQACVPLVLSSVGDPSLLVERVHGWGGRVIQDVTTMRHAEKAVAAGVDGLMLTCAGAGGHTGFLSPFAFVPAVRRFWSGLLIVGGGIADAAGIAAVLALGGDIACMGTRFIATAESAVTPEHRDMIVRVGLDRIMVSAAMNGVPANWIRDSIAAVGLDPDGLPPGRMTMPEGARPWRDIFSAGHSVALIDGVEPAAAVVSRLAAELAAASCVDWQSRLVEISKGWQE